MPHEPELGGAVLARSCKESELVETVARNETGATSGNRCTAGSRCCRESLSEVRSCQPSAHDSTHHDKEATEAGMLCGGFVHIVLTHLHLQVRPLLPPLRPIFARPVQPYEKRALDAGRIFQFRLCSTASRCLSFCYRAVPLPVPEHLENIS